MTRRIRLLASLGAALLASGCGLHAYRARARSGPIDPGLSPIGRALAYLDQTQVKSVLRPFAGGADFPGNWPQHVVAFYPVPLRARDVSPFLPAFIHRSLSLIHEDNQAALGLDDDQIARARVLRESAVEFMRRFESGPDDPAAGAYGFWPRREDVRAYRKPWLGRLRGDGLAGPLFWTFMRGPAFEGPRTCLNVPQLPAAYGIHPDADDTAAVHLALLEAHRIDHGPFPHPPFVLFERWRDVDTVPLRTEPDWRRAPTGAFLTWFAATPNDLDLAVNANVLHLLARHGRLEAPGAAEAQALIADVLPRSLASVYRDDVHMYYPNPLMAYHCVARAFREGPVPGLAPAVDGIADELRRRARSRPDGSVHWNYGQPDLDTALGILVLLDSGRHPDLVPGAIQFLLDRQHPRRGHWPEGWASGGKTGRGHWIGWASAPFSTAMALEALCRFRLAAPDVPDPRWREMAERVRSRN